MGGGGPVRGAARGAGRARPRPRLRQPGCCAGGAVPAGTALVLDLKIQSLPGSALPPGAALTLVKTCNQPSPWLDKFAIADGEGRVRGAERARPSAAMPWPT